MTDNIEQHRASARFFEARSRASPAFVCLIVLAEVAWVLSRTYKLPRGRVLATIGSMIERPEIVIEDPKAVAEALERAAGSSLDFADLLIASINAQGGCDSTVTFDRKAARRLPGMTLLS